MIVMWYVKNLKRKCYTPALLRKTHACWHGLRSANPPRIGFNAQKIKSPQNPPSPPQPKEIVAEVAAQTLIFSDTTILSTGSCLLPSPNHPWLVLSAFFHKPWNWVSRFRWVFSATCIHRPYFVTVATPGVTFKVKSRFSSESLSPLFSFETSRQQ